MVIDKVVPLVTGALAEGASSTFDVTQVMTDSVNTVQGQLFSVLAIVVPAIVLVVGAIVGVKFGISWLKKIRG
ncbi:MAG: hypothetical protein J1F18_11370 [Lachnospiraceae bacterium]|nr:hypothetical protein [Lachnospiraceae bacterium]